MSNASKNKGANKPLCEKRRTCGIGKRYQENFGVGKKKPIPVKLRGDLVLRGRVCKARIRTSKEGKILFQGKKKREISISPTNFHRGKKEACNYTASSRERRI